MAASNKKIEDQVRYEDGKLYWINPRKKCLVGKECGSIQSAGYRIIHFYNKKILVHHIVWYLHTGSWPDPSMQIDHINMNKLDNRIENLRQVSRRINALNNKAENVSLRGNKWRSRVGSFHIGYFSDKEEAIKAAQSYKKEVILKEVSCG